MLSINLNWDYCTQVAMTMKFRKLGKHGMKVSEISLGAWLTYGGTVDMEKAHKCLETAIDLGVNFIDIADVYARGKAEEIVGAFLEKETVKRSDLVISSKVFWPMSDNENDRGLSRKHISESIQKTLDRLKTDYLDIYYCHRYDMTTPLEETVDTMGGLVDSGEVYYWGTSAWRAPQITEAIFLCDELGVPKNAVEQPRYNMLDRFIELEIMETVKRHGVGLTPFSPLAQGLLTGKYDQGTPEDSRAVTHKRLVSEDKINESKDKVRELGKIAKENGMLTNQLALAWVLRRKEISSAITGASKPEQIVSNVEAVKHSLSKDLCEQIEGVLNNKPELPPLYRAPYY